MFSLFFVFCADFKGVLPIEQVTVLEKDVHFVECSSYKRLNGLFDNVDSSETQVRFDVHMTMIDENPMLGESVREKRKAILNDLIASHLTDMSLMEDEVKRFEKLVKAYMHLQHKPQVISDSASFIAGLQQRGFTCAAITNSIPGGLFGLTPIHSILENLGMTFGGRHWPRHCQLEKGASLDEGVVSSAGNNKGRMSRALDMAANTLQSSGDVLVYFDDTMEHLVNMYNAYTGTGVRLFLFLTTPLGDSIPESKVSIDSLTSLIERASTFSLGVIAQERMKDQSRLMKYMAALEKKRPISAGSEVSTVAQHLGTPSERDLTTPEGVTPHNTPQKERAKLSPSSDVNQPLSL